jgi:hypothetical protein
MLRQMNKRRYFGRFEGRAAGADLTHYVLQIRDAAREALDAGADELRPTLPSRKGALREKSDDDRRSSQTPS